MRWLICLVLGVMLLLTLLSCTPQTEMVIKATSIADYCHSVGEFAADIMRAKTSSGLPEENLWILTKNKNHEVLLSAPREQIPMRKVVAFVYATPELSPDDVAITLAYQCLWQRKTGDWFLRTSPE